ncbi:MAG: hypothetical protein M3094_04770, partial [Actinomycetia bacterium]|nr:hypothetical protein [Actinomycetes bacterium]
ALVFGARLFGGSSSQPTPPAAAPQPPVEITATTSTAGVVVSEADLMAGAPEVQPAGGEFELIAIAEWFVTDYFTIDGSPETARSVRALLSPVAGTIDLPHEADPAPPITYVEWARATDSRRVTEGEFAVDVVYRTITDTGEGFERDAVHAVRVTLLVMPGSAGVAGPPIQIEVPELGG